MLAIDKFFSLLAFCTTFNRLIAPPLAVAILFFSGMETNFVIMAFVFAVIALTPYVVVVAGISLTMKLLNFVDWSWMDALVPASSLLLLPAILFFGWLVANLRMEITLQDGRSPRLPPEIQDPKVERRGTSE